MKLLFLCSTLEEGKDGVGDYTRRLAGEIIRQGNQAIIIAYNDRHINSSTNGVQQDGDTAIEVLRLSSLLKVKEKVQLARNCVIRFQPDWISLQFVVYAFHPKGLPFFLTKQLKQIGKGYKWHIMFHELWIGMNMESNFKERYIGKTQKFIIRGLVRYLNVEFIHTNTKLYLMQIKNLTQNIKSDKLPLFSNIPTKRIIPILKDTKKLVLILFGNIHPYTDIHAFINWCKTQQDILNRKIEFHFIGKNGFLLDNWTAAVKSQELSYTIHGFQSTDSIIKLLSVADAGITTTPLPLAGKSGTVATILTMGLPVLCTANQWRINSFSNPKDTPVFQWNNNIDLTSILNSKPDIELSLEHITKRFIQDLSHG